MKTNFLLVLLLFWSAIGLAQSNNAQTKTATQIKKNISFARTYVYSEHPNYDIDSMCKVTANKVVNLMTGNNYSTVYYKNLGLRLSAECVESKDKNGLKIYSFGFDCGGTRRVITHPIIQWKNRQGKTFAYNFSSKINCDFYKIHKLKSPSRDLYLLIGTEAGDSNCYQGIVYVIEIKGNYVILNSPVFVNRPYLNLCNREYEFDPKTQVLTSMLQHETTPYPLESAVDNQREYSKDKLANTQLINLIGPGYNSKPSIFYLKFNGFKFVQED